MNQERLRRVQTIACIVGAVAVAIGLILYALSENISLFYTPSEFRNASVSTLKGVRIGGMVAKDSVERKGDLTIHFQVTDFKQSLEVAYTGILPDLFKEGSGVVVQGSLQPNGIFKADQVLAKHDENYMPSSIKTALSKQGVE